MIRKGDPMARVYSQDLRERLIGAVEAGQSASAASRVFKVSRSIAIKWVAHWQRTGEVPEAKPRAHYRWRLDAHKAWLLALVAEEPDLTLEGIRDRFVAERDGKSCVNSLWRFYDRYEITYKKPFSPRNRNGLMWPPPGKSGRPNNTVLIPNAWSSWTRPGPRPT